jgi:DNA-binding GntR family transcriptional regulator
VIIRPHLGASVKKMDFKEYREMCGLRLALEVYAAGLAAQIRTDEELVELRHALDEMAVLTRRIVEESPEDRGVLELLRRADVRFHIGIIAAAKSDLLRKEVLRLHIVTRVVTSPSPARQGAGDPAMRSAHRLDVQKSHEEIFGAIERQDSAAAKSAMELHIQDIIDGQIRNLAQEKTVVTRELSEEELSYTS